MRIYLSGRLMVLNPDIKALHHHAPSGGLRTHGARVITYAEHRNQLTQRAIPATTRDLSSARYFSARQVREFLWIQTAATLAFRGPRLRRILKAIVGVAMLPDTLRKICRRDRDARAMLAAGPKIPRLPDTPAARR